MESVNTKLDLFCSRKTCCCYQKTDNLITKMGTYPVKSENIRRQLFWCHGGYHKFSETGYSDLWGKQGSFKEYEQTAKLQGYGLSNERIADVLEKDERTIASWTEAINKKSRLWHIWLCSTIGLIIRFLQMDELWSYAKKKSNQLWVFAAIDVPSRFWICFETGKRTTKSAKRLVEQVYQLGCWSPYRLLRICTDKLKAYQNAIEFYFGQHRYVYLQIVKKRVKRKLKTVKKCFVRGREEDFPVGTQNTSFIERFNLTLRRKVSYLSRKTIGFCKKHDHFDQKLWISLFDYNYRQSHKSLRQRLPGNRKYKFVKKFTEITPAMKMGITNTSIQWKFLFIAPIPK